VFHGNAERFVPLERKLARHHFIQNGSKRINVGAKVHFL
jgi:hypothetical protein